MEMKQKARVAILISDKIAFKTKPIIKDKEGHHIMIKGSIQIRILYLLPYIHPIHENQNT